jgi:hypothetical protein
MPKRVIENPVLAIRYVAIHAEFKPEGNPRDNLRPLMDLWIEVHSHVNRVRDCQLRQKAREQLELGDAIDKLSPLVASVLQGERDGASITDDMLRLVPDEALRKKVFDWYSDLNNQKPETQPPEELEAQEKDLAARDKALKCGSAILNSLTRLSEATEEGDPAAARELLEAATTAAGFLAIATSRHPQLFKELAAMAKMWPVLASDEPGWEKAAVSEVNGLELGKGLAFIKTRLRPLRGSDVALPARRWAKAAVQTIDETRWRFPFFVQMVDELGGSDAWADFAIVHNWDTVKYPDWTKTAMALKPLSVETFDSWKAVVREIIREQVTDFHLLPEWATQRMTAEANGRGTPGEIQNAILDDIVSALKRLVPEARC